MGAEIYLDNAATTKPINSILEVIKPYIETQWFNPSTLYSKGRDVREKIECVRCQLAKEISANSDEIYFTSGASESNNWVIRGFIDQCKIDGIKPVIITTQIEHKSILECITNISKIHKVCEYNFVAVHKESGLVKREHLEKLLEYYKRVYGKCAKILISICMANSEIGTIQDIGELVAIAHEYNAIFHTDATQAFGHIPINTQVLGVDLLTASAQKFGGLKGTGFLFKRASVNIKPLIYGSQEQGQRGGTENVVGIIAMDEAIKHIDYCTRQEKMLLMRDYFTNQLVDKFDCKVNGSMKSRLPNNINVTFPQAITGELLIYLLDIHGIYISSGSACNLAKPSSVLQAIGLTEDEISRTIRITMPDDITKEDIDYVIETIQQKIMLCKS